MEDHQCQQGRRCQGRTRTPNGQWHAAGVERPRTLCHPCEEACFAAIRSLPDDFRLLSEASTNPTGIRRRAPKVRRTPGRSIPINVEAHALMSAIDDETFRWALRLDPDINDNLPRDAQRRVERCVTALSTRLGTLIDQPVHVFSALLPHPDGGDHLGREALDGVDAVLRLDGYHRRTRSILGLTEASKSYLNGETCHVCAARTLFVHIHEHRIHCRSCQNTWEQDDFARLNNPLAAA
ncbi:hypothetical protein SAMN04244553_3608 [Nocardia amikacinitolerans]|uniref:Uncharacterized protein n=1 Tax=Nocardia amikacinitolerans TaxID=756689 RepID=A0A285LJI5_9NOCA|nr:hypothetical protein [Nocardia amikacinitolerans]SNY84207.1 hypothetical protein SAMN04244553_3608 [Nocardia amikacinitolerans]